MSEWYLEKGKVSAGPFSWEHVSEMLRSGVITPEDYVWREGLDDWIPLTAARAAMEPPQPPPPPAPPQLAAPSGPSDRTSEPEQSAPIVIAANGWSSRPVGPWRRYGARTLDSMVNGLLGAALIAYIWYSVDPRGADTFFEALEKPGGPFVDLVVTLLITGVVNGFMIGATGTTIGKALFGVKVVNRQIAPIGLLAGLAREARVFLFGLGLGIPLVSLITVIAGYSRLKKTGETRWDKDRCSVLHRPGGALDKILAATGILVLVAAIVAVGILNSSP